MIQTVDINCDLGEGMANDAALMPYISSCSIACGGHAGTVDTMREAVQLAKRYHVKVGAHPSFPDSANFGRVKMGIAPEVLLSSIVEQIQTLKRVCDEEGVQLDYVKLHGALYNLSVTDATIAQCIISAIQEANGPFKIFTPYNSKLVKIAPPNFEFIFEAFIDRRYADNLTLISRTHPKAVIENPQEAWQQLHEMLTTKTVLTLSGKKKPMNAETFCLHGDHESAEAIAQYVHQKLKEQSIKVGRYETS